VIEIAALAWVLAADIPFGPNSGSLLPALHAPNQVALADLDGDGLLDAIVPGRNTDRLIRWALGTGATPSFGPWRELELPSQADWAVVEPGPAAAPNVLLALRALQGSALRLDNLGQAHFAVGASWPQEREPRTMDLADITGDGLADLVVANASGPTLRIDRADGLGGFVPHQRLRNDDWYGGTGSLQQVRGSDIDGDGWVDVVASSISTGSLLTWRNRGGVLVDWPVHTPIQPLVADQPAITTFTLADMDDDGDDDVVAQLLSLGLNQPLVICWNDGGSFTRQDSFPGPDAGYGWTCAVADLDRDGDLDVVTSVALLSGGLYLMENIGTPKQPAFDEAVLKRPSPFVRHIELADTDGDCDLDIVAADISSHAIIRLPNLTGCGFLQQPPAAATRGRARDAGATLPQLPRGQRPMGGALGLHGRGAPATTPAARAIALDLARFGAPPSMPGAHGSLASATCGPGDGSAGRCDEPHPSPGCFTTACCETVCLIAPDCCVIAWDQACVDIADDECDGLYCPAPGSCGEAHDTGGCDDEACCARTVRLDGWCGSALWDQTCVDDAAWWCPFVPCELEGPPGARPEGEACYDRINDGCTLPEPAFEALSCGERVAGRCTTGAPRDTDWYALPAGGVTIGLRAEFPASLMVVRGSCVTTLEQVSWHAIGPCEPLLTTMCVPPGESWFAIVSLGSPEGPIQSGQPCTDQDPDNPPDPDDPPITPGAFGTRYEVSLSCGACPPSPDLNRDGVVNGADLGLLLSAWGVMGNDVVGDLNGDGVVDGADLGALLTAWS
jgi:hypothetical protein